jgi:hypothetical protein
MKTVPLTQQTYEIWNDFCDKSDDAWFWHRADWLSYLRAMAGDRLIKDTSFFIYNNTKLLAVMPCMVLSSDSDGSWIGLVNEPSPWPAFDPDLSIKQRKTVEKEVFDQIESIAHQHDVGRAELFGSIETISFRNSAFSPNNLPLRYGYEGTVGDTQILDLTLPENILWENIRKGHKSSIKQGQKLLEINTMYGGINDDDFQDYHDMHSLAAGHQTRPQTTFDAMKEWIRNRKAILVSGSYREQRIGFVFIMLYKDAAVYASACNHPDQPIGSIGHALLWEGIKIAKLNSARIFNLGTQTYTSKDNPKTNNKMVNISKFKRGFGGFPMPRMVAVRTFK